MMQLYNVLLWAGPQRLDDCQLLNLTESIILALREYGEELNPKYLTVSKKKNAKHFSFTKEELLKLLRRSTNKEGDKVFYDLGRTFSFFSSLKEEESAGLFVTIGCENPKFNNLLSIDLPYGGFSGFNERQEDFYVLFKSLVEIFKPYFAFVYNSQNKHLSDTFWNGKPTYAHWMNYYSEDTIRLIGERKFSSLSLVDKSKHGVFLRLFGEALDINNTMHLDKQKIISQKLGLI